MRIGIAGTLSPSLLATVGLPELDFERSHGFPTLSVLVLLLRERGHDVTVYTCIPQLEETRVVRGDRLTVCLIPMRPRHRGRDLYRVERASIAEMMRAYPVDVMNAWWSYEYALAGEDVDPDTIITVQDHATAILRYYRDAYRAARWVMNWQALARGRYLIANSPYMRAQLRRGVRSKAMIIPNFMNPALRDIPLRPREAREGVITVAQDFSPRKNIEAAVRAIRLVRRSHPGAVLRLVGEDMALDGMAARWASSEGLCDGVEFLGPLPYAATMRAIAESAVMLHPSREESFGMVLLEAMALGTPVVAVEDAGAVPYILDGGKAGVLCDADDHAQMAAAVAGLLASPDEASALAERARRAARRFAPETVVAQYETAYAYVLNRKSRLGRARVR